MAKCLRCGAGPEWIQGKVQKELRADVYHTPTCDRHLDAEQAPAADPSLCPFCVVEQLLELVPVGRTEQEMRVVDHAQLVVRSRRRG